MSVEAVVTQFAQAQPAMRILPSAAAAEAAALISMIERAARDPAVDIDRVERMYVMFERASARSAKAAFIAALAEMQAKLPIIEKRGTIGTNEKNAQGVKTGRQVAMTAYAKWEDVVEGITPILGAHGFSISFRIAQPAPDRVAVTAVLGHRDGHTEETSLALPIDSSGAKNNVQGWGSSVSYGKRYTAFALLNIVARGEDDDARGVEGAPVITDEQAMVLREAIEATDSDLQAFCKYFKVEALAELKAADYERAVAALKKKNRR